MLTFTTCNVLLYAQHSVTRMYVREKLERVPVFFVRDDTTGRCYSLLSPSV
jgi:hypothetical protein